MAVEPTVAAAGAVAVAVADIVVAGIAAVADFAVAAVAAADNYFPGLVDSAEVGEHTEYVASERQVPEREPGVDAAAAAAVASCAAVAVVTVMEQQGPVVLEEVVAMLA